MKIYLSVNFKNKEDTYIERESYLVRILFSYQYYKESDKKVFRKLINENILSYLA